MGCFFDGGFWTRVSWGLLFLEGLNSWTLRHPSCPPQILQENPENNMFTYLVLSASLVEKTKQNYPQTFERPNYPQTFGK